MKNILILMLIFINLTANQDYSKIYKQGVKDTIKIMEYISLKKNKDIFISKDKYSVLISIDGDEEYDIVKKSIVVLKNNYDFSYVEINNKNWIFIESKSLTKKKAFSIKNKLELYKIDVSIDNAVSGRQKTINLEMISTLIDLKQIKEKVSEEQKKEKVSEVEVKYITKSDKFQVVNRIITKNFYDRHNWKTYTETKPFTKYKYNNMQDEKKVKKNKIEIKKNFINSTKKEKEQKKKTSFKSFNDLYKEISSKALIKNGELYYSGFIYKIGDKIKVKDKIYMLEFLDNEKGILIIKDYENNHKRNISIKKKNK